MGILIDSGAKAVLLAARIKVPFNHVSLKFNEWIGRKLNLGVSLLDEQACRRLVVGCVNLHKGLDSTRSERDVVVLEGI